MPGRIHTSRHLFVILTLLSFLEKRQFNRRVLQVHFFFNIFEISGSGVRIPHSPQDFYNQRASIAEVVLAFFSLSPLRSLLGSSRPSLNGKMHPRYLNLLQDA